MVKKIFAASVIVASAICGLFGANASAASEAVTISGGAWNICVSTSGSYSGSNFVVNINGDGFESQLVFDDFENEGCKSVKLPAGSYSVSVDAPMGVNNMSSNLSGDRISFSANVGANKYLNTYGISKQTNLATSIDVSFDANGGTGNMAGLDGANLTTTLSSNSFTRAGYEFAGWNTAADGSGTTYSDGETVTFDPSGETTLYAQWKMKTAEMITGQDFNIALKRLAGTDVGDEPDKPSNMDAWIYYGITLEEVDGRSSKADNNITEIRFVNELPDGVSLANAVQLAAGDSRPIYAFNNDGVITVYSDAAKIYFDKNCRNMFNNMKSLANISDPLSMIDTSRVENMGFLFYRANSLTNLSFLSGWDTSNVIAMQGIFGFTGITSLSGVENWNTSNVEILHDAFAYTNVTNVDALLNWDVRKVQDMVSMFYFDRDLTNISGLRNWQTDSLTDIGWCFWRAKISDITALKDFKMGKVQSIMYMFRYTLITDLSPISGWDVSQVKSFRGTFAGVGFTSLEPLRNWTVDNAEDMYNMFASEVIISEEPDGLGYTSKVVSSSVPSLEPISGWNVSKVKDFSRMFIGFDSVDSLDILNGWRVLSDAVLSNMFDNIPDTLTRPDWYIAWQAAH